MRYFLTIGLLAASLLLTARSQTAVTEETKEQSKAIATVEEYTLPGGSKVTVENKTKVLYQETGKNSMEKTLRRVAIFANNNAGKEFDDALPRILDQVAAQAAGENFEFIDHRDALMAIQAMPDAVKTAEGVAQQAGVEMLQAGINRSQGNRSNKNLGGSGTTMDERLLAQSSIVQLAQQLDADYIMRISLDRFDKSVRDRKFGEARWLETTYTLSATYKLMDFGGYSIGGNTLRVKRSEKKGEDDRSQMGAFADGLDEEVAEKLAKEMIARAAIWRKSSLTKSKIPVFFDTLAMSMDNQPMYVPQFDTNQAQVVLGTQVPARIAALVEVDGVTVGTTDCEVPLTPGVHKVRFYSDGHDDVTMTINAREGLKIVAPMRITEGEMERIQKLQSFINDLTLKRKFGEAEVKVLEGEAEKLRNSHIRIDANNMPDMHIYRSLF